MKVSLFKNQKPLCHNLNKWNNSEYPLLLITGLSGSGKTTYAKKITRFFTNYMKEDIEDRMDWSFENLNF